MGASPGTLTAPANATTPVASRASEPIGPEPSIHRPPKWTFARARQVKDALSAQPDMADGQDTSYQESSETNGGV